MLPPSFAVTRCPAGYGRLSLCICGCFDFAEKTAIAPVKQGVTFETITPQQLACQRFAKSASVAKMEFQPRAVAASTGFTENPRGVKLRNKLVQNALPNPQ